MLGVALFFVCVATVLGRSEEQRKTQRRFGWLFVLVILNEAIPFVRGGIPAMAHCVRNGDFACFVHSLQGVLAFGVLAVATIGLFAGTKWARWALVGWVVLLASVCVWRPEMKHTGPYAAHEAEVVVAEGVERVERVATAVRAGSANWFYLGVSALALADAFFPGKRRGEPARKRLDACFIEE